MKPSLIIFGLVIILACCNKSDDQASANTTTDQAQATVVRKTQSKTAFDYSAARASLRNNKNPRKELITTYSRAIEATEGLDTGKALGKLYSEVANGLEKREAASLKVAFASSIIEDSQNSASLMGSLPAGELRTECVMSILEPSVSIELAKGIYEAFPESSDRKRAGKLLVQKSYLRQGVEPALDVLATFESASERRDALLDFGLKVHAARLEGRDSDSTSMGKVVDFAAKNGFADLVNIFRKLEYVRQSGVFEAKLNP